MHFRHLTLLLMLTIALSGSAQDFLYKNYIGIGGGGMNYQGDLNKQSLFGKVNLAGEIFFRHDFDDRWSLNISTAYGHIEGGNPDKESLRNLSFRSMIWEAGARIEFNFVPFGRGGKHYRTTPYLFAGINFFHFNPMAQYFDSVNQALQWAELQPLGTEGQNASLYPDRTRYTLNQIAIPFGLGFKALIGEDIVLSFEYGFRKTWTDYLDDVSTTYVGRSVLDNGTDQGRLAASLADRSDEVQPDYVNAPGIKRGDDSLNDWYSFFNISISFRMEFLFGWMKSKDCETGK